LEEWFTQVTPKNAFFYWLGNKCFPTIWPCKTPFPL
jgi:hypothetical protein